MTLKNHITLVPKMLVAVFVFAAFWQAGAAYALLEKNAAEKVWHDYVDTKSDFEKNVHQLVITKFPKEEKISKLHLDLELKRLKQKTAQFKYLQEKDPARVNEKKSLEDFTQFKWTDKDDKALRGTDKSYAKMSREIKGLEKQYDNHPQHAKFEKNLDDVKGSVEYRSMSDKFNSMIAHLQSSFEDTKRDIKKKL